MCQELPGPRCASHTKTAVETARTLRADAEQAVTAAVAALQAARAAGATLATSVDEHAALAQARQDQDAARVAYSTALAEYQTTPTGQEDLRTAIEQLRAAGDTDAAENAAQALETAITTRAQQVADLSAARAQRARLDAADSAEQAALTLADAHVTGTETALAAAQDHLAECDEAVTAMSSEYETVQAEHAAATRLVRAAQADAERAVHAVTTEARRLYRAAGVNDRMAGYYCEDMVTTAREKHPVPGSRDDGPLGKALKIKVKRNGADRDATLAAAEAAKTDPGFVAANRDLSLAVAAARQAKQHATEMYRSDVEPVTTAWTERTRKALQAQYAVEDATKVRDKAVADAHLLRARIGAGMGPDGPPSVPLARARDEIVRNPDGTTNAYAYRAPSPGFPHGRMAAAVDVTTTRGGWSPVNALVLEDGTTVAASEHYYRGRSGAQVDRADTRIYLTTAQDGATPLRAENHADAGFMAFVDSTD